MLKHLKNYFLDEDGQTSTEYILLVAIVAIIITKFGGQLKSKLFAMLEVLNPDDIKNQMNAEMQ